MKIMHRLLPLAIVAAGALALPTVAAPPRPTPEQVLGKRLYLRCVACHSVTATAGPKIGPHLANIVGRRAGAVAGFNYSPAMRGSAVVWNEATLDRWLQRPQAVVPGTTMAFAGLAKPEERRALIAYLKRPTP